MEKRQIEKTEKIKEIKTQGLDLRRYEKKDMEFVMSIWNDPEMGTYLPDPVFGQIDEIYQRALETLSDDRSCWYFIAELKETGERIGTCSIMPKEEFVYDIAYCVHKKYWRNGYASEMVQGIMEYARQKGIKKITVSVAKENAASKAVIKKFGFEIVGEGSFKKRGTNIVVANNQYEYVFGGKKKR